MANAELQLLLLRQLEVEHPDLVRQAKADELKTVKVDPSWSRMGAARDSSFVRLAQRLAREGRSVRLALLRSGEVVVYASRDADPNRVIALTDVSVQGQPSPFGSRLQDIVEHGPPEALHGPLLASATAARRAASALVLHTPLPVLACQLVEIRERGSGLELVWNLLPSTSATEPIGRLKVQGKQDLLRGAVLEWLAARPAHSPVVVPAQEPAQDERTLQQLFDEAVDEAEREAEREATRGPEASPAPTPAAKKEGLFTRAIASQASGPRSRRRQLLGFTLVVTLFVFKVHQDLHEDDGEDAPTRRARRAAPAVQEPTVRQGRPPTIFGHIPARELNAVMEEAMAAMTLCYSWAVEQNHGAPGLSGTLELRLVINEGGTLSRASIGPDYQGHPSLSTCALDAVNGMVWPQPTEPGAVLASYWLDFAKPEHDTKEEAPAEPATEPEADPAVEPDPAGEPSAEGAAPPSAP